MKAPKEVSKLVNRFRENREAYLSGEYNETQLRREFLDPFFRALGWDIDNEQGYAEAYKDVIHEDAIKIGGATKAPDYAFRIGGKRMFFVEAKRPSVGIKSDPDAAYQLRRYGWSAKLSLSILSDFEELAVYDCRVRPRSGDKASIARILYFTFDEYEDKWDEIAGIFDREAILKGSFDRYIEANKKRGTAEVDDAFLKEIEGWRDVLARNIALRNTELTNREVNFAVQRTVDRIIFLRICEDRGIEESGQLLALCDGTDVYQRLCDVFRRADDRYNSGLFHFRKERDRVGSADELTPNLLIDDRVLKAMFKNLYYPESPYEFSVLPADILGHIYEQFLGKVIRLTRSHRAVIEEKPEVRKAGGVYYTPTYIVDYIVEHTVGKLLEGKTPKHVAKLRVLDPACGSGSFLLGAYQRLLDWHLTWYSENEPKKHAKGRKPKVFQGPSGDWRLTSAERKRILLNNIYGVDIDPQAVEVTKLSLLLKVLEKESAETLGKSLRLFHERALPDLGDSIKCGNSLIGPDIHEGKQLSLIDEDEVYRINAFDWETEFPGIMSAGGFDAVIGNPPYVRQETLSDLKEYLSRHYEAFHGGADLYAYFMERSVTLLRDGGRFSYIVSSSFLRTTYGEPLRRTLRKHAALLRLVDFGGLAVFANAKDTYVCIPLLAKVEQPARVDITKVPSLKIQDLVGFVTSNSFSVPHARLSAKAWALRSDEEASVFMKIMKAGMPLGEYVDRKMFYGIKTGLNRAFVIDTRTRQRLVSEGKQNAELIKPLLAGQDIRRYFVRDRGNYLIVIPQGWTRLRMAEAENTRGSSSERAAWDWLVSEYPGLAGHLRPFEDALRRRQDQGDYWWELRPCGYYEYLDAPKIVFPDICKGSRFYVDRTGMYPANTAYSLGTDDLYLLGVLNSRLFWFAISNISIPFGVRAGQYRYRLIYQYMEKVPIRVIDTATPEDRVRHSRITELVERVLELHLQLGGGKTGHDRELIERQIDATDKRIDRLVYELYSLTEKEIRVIEEASST